MDEEIAVSEFDINDDWGGVWQARIDVNQDGLADLVQYTNSVRSWAATLDVYPVAYLRIYVQQDDGSLVDESASLIRDPVSPIMGVDMTLADFNRDGVIDFLLAGSGWDAAFDAETGPQEYEQGEPDVVFISEPDGSWRTSQPFDSNIWTHNVAVGDFNGDGFDDFFSTSIEIGNNQLTLSDPDRSFLSINDQRGGFAYNQSNLPNSLTVADSFFTDFNNLSYLDDDGNTVYPGTTYTGTVAFDANADSHVDLVVLSNARSKSNLLFLNDGTGVFPDEPAAELPEPIFGFGGHINLGSVENFEFDFRNKGTIGLEANAADIDRDSDLDLVILSTFENNRPGETNLSYAGTGIQVLENDGEGNFSISQEIILAENVNRIYLHDFEFYDINRDGQIDIVLQGTHYNEEYYLTEVLLNESGQFSNATETYIESKTKQYFPFHRDGELHFFSYDFEWVSQDPRDGEANARATFQTLRSSETSGNQIAGSNEAEQLIGSSAADIFISSGGHDVLDGHEGEDTVIYSGLRDTHTITISEARVTVEDRSNLSQGLDTLNSIEVLSFFDQDVSLSIFGGAASLSQNDFETFIELYIAYFNRSPDAVGLNFWGTAFANGTTLEQMATFFVDQDETRTTYPEGTSNTDFVTAVYGNVLGRIPDQAGFNFWIDMLNRSEETGVTRDQFILEVLRGVQDGSSDRSFLDSKVDIGAYFAVHRGMSDVDNASAAMALFDGSQASINQAMAAIDGFYQDALDPRNGEFLMQLVGVLDDPFAG